MWAFAQKIVVTLRDFDTADGTVPNETPDASWLAPCTLDAEQMNPPPLMRSTPDYLHAAVSARARLGIAALAKELALDPERTKSLIWAHYEATQDDTPYADCLDRGALILATRAALPVSQVQSWISDGFEFGRVVTCPPSLRRLLDSLDTL